MKKITIILLFILFASSLRCYASHVAGVELTAVHDSGDRYIVTLTFYRDCSGVSVDTTASINFISTVDTFSVLLPLISGTGSELPIYCTQDLGFTTSCSGGSIYGVQEYKYQGKVNLPPSDDWKIYFSLCCRNPINTINNSTSADIYIEADLDNFNAPFNSLPSFSAEPKFVLCNGQPINLYNSANDLDGDSLAFKFITPYDDGPNGAIPIVSFNPGYYFNQPINSLFPISLNNASGYIYVNPTLNIRGVYAIQVDEYRRINNIPVKIGSVMRDLQIEVISCNLPVNEGPCLAGINPNSLAYNVMDFNYSYDVVGNTNLSFNVYPHSVDTNRHISLSWNNGIPSAFFYVSNNNTPNAIGHFNWITTLADTSFNPSCFEVSVSDSMCVNTYQYCINVFSHLNNIESYDSDNGLLIYPNPASEFISIDFKNLTNGNNNIKIIDYKGQTVLSKDYNLNNSNHNLQVPICEIDNGIYFIIINGEKETIKKKLVVIK